MFYLVASGVKTLEPSGVFTLCAQDVCESGLPHALCLSGAPAPISPRAPTIILSNLYVCPVRGQCRGMRPALLFTSIVIAMLLLALAKMPYGYYTVLKLTACIYFVYVALNLPRSTRSLSIFLSWGLAAAYNPVLRLPLGRETWSVVNVLTVFACVYLYRMLTAGNATQDNV